MGYDRNIFSAGVHEPLDGPPLVYVFLDELGDIGFLYPAVECALGIDHYDRPHFAHSVASCRDDEHLFSESFFGDRFFERFRHLRRSAGGAPGAAADQDVGTINRHVSSSLR